MKLKIINAPVNSWLSLDMKVFKLNDCHSMLYNVLIRKTKQYWKSGKIRFSHEIYAYKHPATYIIY